MKTDDVESYAWALLYKTSASGKSQEEEARDLVRLIEEDANILNNDVERQKQGQNRAREIQKEIEANKKAKKEAEEKTKKDGKDDE